MSAMFGLGKGKLEIRIPKKDYLRGESIEGTIVLHLNQPVQARELRVVLSAIKNTGSGRNSSFVTVYERKLVLDGEHVYRGGDYRFKFDIPEGVPVSSKPKLQIGPVKVFPGSRGIWLLNASLDIPNSFDVSKNIRINIS
ncbi:MAG: hypothetical protein J7L23_02205 [Candidatus Diapherotrites archaeon]|nr:hypothetical protein [Candidatus Diapherotrites archaeon]